MLKKHKIKVSYMIYDRSQISWTFTKGIEELNTEHVLRAAPKSSQSRIFKAGVTNTWNPAIGFIYQTATWPL